MDNLCACETYIGSVWVAVPPAPPPYLVSKPLEAAGAGRGRQGGGGDGGPLLVLGHQVHHTQTRETIDLFSTDCTNTRWGQ